MSVPDINVSFEVHMAGLSLQPNFKKPPLQTLLHGGDCGDYLLHLESVLLGQSAQSIKDLTKEELHENFLFLLAHSGNPDKRIRVKSKTSDFSLLLYLLPYYIPHLEGICTPKVMQSLDKSRCDVALALKDRIKEVLLNKNGFYQDTQSEWQNLQALLRLIGAPYFSETTEKLFITVLQRWNSVIQPTFEEKFSIANKLAELSLTLSRTPVDAEYAKKVNQLRYTFLEHLQPATPGQVEVAETQAMIQMSLVQSSNKGFHTFPPEIRREGFMLFLYNWAESRTPTDFCTVIHMIPYNFNQVAGVCNPELMAASVDTFVTVLVDQQHTESLPVDSWEDLQILLTRFPLEKITDPIGLFALALGRWITFTHPEPQDAAIHLMNFAKFATEWSDNTESEERWEIFKQMIDNVKDNDFMLRLLYELCKSDPDHPTACAFDMSWAEELEAKQRQELRLFVDLANCCTGSWFKNPLSDIWLACRLVPSLDTSTSEQLLVMLDHHVQENPDSRLINSFVESANLPAISIRKRYGYVNFLITRNTPSGLLLASRILTTINMNALRSILSELERSIKEHTCSQFHQKALQCLLAATWVKDKLVAPINTIDEPESILLQQQLNVLSLLTQSDQTLTPATWRKKMEDTLYAWKHKSNATYEAPLLPKVLKSSIGLRAPIFWF